MIKRKKINVTAPKIKLTKSEFDVPKCNHEKLNVMLDDNQYHK